ncbi:MAG: TonB-dependent receptor [Rikenellaceae bacterium]
MNQKRGFLFVTLMLLAMQIVGAATFKGVVVDSTTGESLLGASIMIKGTTNGAATGLSGEFELNGEAPMTIIVSYISYITQEVVLNSAAADIKIKLEPDVQRIDQVQVVTRGVQESEASLQVERFEAAVAIENIGIKEMSLKGLSNAEAGVKKMTGITIADAGEVVVRGLGDRYSLTTLNGVPIASPNPDNKLIPLDIFPSSTIKNITVSKVFKVSSFADYSGALIDIATKDMVSENFFSVSVSLGGNFSSTGRDFYQMERAGSLLTTPSMPEGMDNLGKSTDFDNYIKSNDIFDTSFAVEKRTSLPDASVQVGYGHTWDVGVRNNLDLLLSLGVKRGEDITTGYMADIWSDGTVASNFSYDSYSETLEISSLASLGYSFGVGQHIGYSMFYARNAEDNYRLREGSVDKENLDGVVGSNSVLRVYSLLNNQLSGQHMLNDKWELDWIGSYSQTVSSEPDRRQVMFIAQDDDTYSAFTDNAQETMRFFGELNESEVVAHSQAKYKLNAKNELRFGGAYRRKDRDYQSMKFYYDYVTAETLFDDVYDTSSSLNYSNIQSGALDIDLSMQPSDKYFAASRVVAGFAEVDYYFGKLMVNAGVRYENSLQAVTYWTDGAIEQMSSYNDLLGSDLFPSLNLKYSTTPKSAVRASLSKTVTRPSFIEMSPFLYKESYGSGQIRGNEDLENGYNYNADLRYEFFQGGGGDMFSFGVYYKYLESPIERVQEDAGGSTQYTFLNTDNGTAAGVEFEARKSFARHFRFGLNASYIYTRVVLDEGGGIYTDMERELQGASPYLINADISYAFKPNDKANLSMTLLYNLQGPRIDAVGVNNCHNVIQGAINTLDFVANYSFNDHMSLSLKLDNLLDEEIVYTQYVESYAADMVLGSYKKGVSGSIGLSYKF